MNTRPTCAAAALIASAACAVISQLSVGSGATVVAATAAAAEARGAALRARGGALRRATTLGQRLLAALRCMEARMVLPCVQARFGAAGAGGAGGGAEISARGSRSWSRNPQICEPRCRRFGDRRVGEQLVPPRLGRVAK